MSSLDENPNCRSTWATFRLLGDRLITDEVTRRTGIEPTFASDKGALRSTGRKKKSKTITQRTGAWYLSSEGQLQTTSVERHLIWLLDQIEPARETFLEIAETHDAIADFFCYWLSASGHGGPEVSAGALARISRLNATLGFDFYGPYDDTPLGVSS
jgi:hypothetical protein